MCENDEYAHGTNHLLEAIAQCTERGSSTILCEEDLVSALERLQKKRSHEREQECKQKDHQECGGDQSSSVVSELRYSLVSSGGSAVLSALAGMPLPGLDALADA